MSQKSLQTAPGGIPPGSRGDVSSLPMGADGPAVAALDRGQSVTSFLRLTAIVSVIAAALGIVVAPGLRGVAGETVVEPVNRLSWALSYFMCGLVVATAVLASVELTRPSRLSAFTRAVAIGASGGVLALSTPALSRPLPAPVALALSVGASVVSLVAGWEGVRRPNTRAVGVVITAFALASLGRVASWELARSAVESSNVRLFALGRAFTTGALVIEALGQMFAAAWLGTRSRVFGQLFSSAAVAGAFLLTWNVARGAGDLAAPWQAALHVALGTPPGLPQPFGMSALQVFLVCGSILLGFVAAIQPRGSVAVVSALALCLLGRGAFDTPLRGLATVAAGLWLMVAAGAYARDAGAARREA